MGWGEGFSKKESWQNPLWKRGLFQLGLKSPPPLQLEEGQKGFVVQGTTLEALFINAATTLFSHLVEKIPPKGIQSLDDRTVDITATTPTELLVNWLNVLLSLFNRQGMVCAECDVIEIDERHLEAEVAGEAYNSRNHKLNVLIKRVLAHQSRVQKTGGLWQAAVVYEPEVPTEVPTHTP
ncbi:MAG: archease [Candidatus Binatia bacterium]